MSTNFDKTSPVVNEPQIVFKYKNIESIQKALPKIFYSDVNDETAIEKSSSTNYELQPYSSENKYIFVYQSFKTSSIIDCKNSMRNRWISSWIYSILS